MVDLTYRFALKNIGMKRFISFSVFAMIVILSLVIRNTVGAQVVVRQRAVVVAPSVVARPICPGSGYVWRNNGWTMRRHYRPHVAYGVHMRARPAIRYRRYS
ncbi:hypothetical protein BH09BAC3_BH09BAC3_16720 [soil metagenome]